MRTRSNPEEGVGSLGGGGTSSSSPPTPARDTQAANPEVADAGAGPPGASQDEIAVPPGAGAPPALGAAGSSATLARPSGSSCDGESLASGSASVNLLLLLDRSTSMLEPALAADPSGPSRWDALVDGVSAFLDAEPALDARVGLQFFGLEDGADDCGVDKYRTPAVPVAPLAGNRSALRAALAATRPGSLTPTAPALTGALEYSLQLAQQPDNTGVPAVLVLFSDGVPSECGTLGPDGSTILSLGDLLSPLRRFARPTAQATDAPAQPPIRTFVVSQLGGNATALAEAGGGRAFLVGVPEGTAPGSAQDISVRVTAALRDIVAHPFGCELALPPSAPGGDQPLDRELVRVMFTAANGITNELVRTEESTLCGITPAWYLVPGATTLSLCPSACALIGAGDLQLQFGCAARTGP